MTLWEIYETCPYCDDENEYLLYPPITGYKATCQECGKEIMLCTVCPLDMPGECDWHKVGRCGVCSMGITRE